MLSVVNFKVSASNIKNCKVTEVFEMPSNDGVTPINAGDNERKIVQ